MFSSRTRESMCLVSVLFTLLAKNCHGARELKSLASDLNRYIHVYPIVHHGRTKREISSTRDTNGLHHPEVHVTVPIDGSPWLLELRLNKDLVTENHTLQYQEEGNTVKHKPKREELDLCHYSGSVRDKPQSWVAVSTCHGVRGVIFDGQKMINIEPAQGSELSVLSPHYLYEDSGFNTDYEGGLHGDVISDITYDHKIANRRERRGLNVKKIRASKYKRGTNNTQVRGPYNADKHSRIMEIVMIADNSVFLASGKNVKAVHTHMIEVANVLNSIYTPLNIFVALVGVVVWSERDEIQIHESMDQTLINLKTYRRKLLKDIPHDNTPLITRQSFSEGHAGLGFVSTMCSIKASCSVSRICTLCRGLPYLLAHEIGHNLGLHHDFNIHSKVCSCQAKSCVMSGKSLTSQGMGMWSDCSVEYLANSEEKYDCLRNIPKRLFESPTCGNGFVEPGEQCDCGITAGGGINPCHACCHPDTCMLRANATCGAGACCDFTTCRMMPEAVVCRSAEQECDLPEYCTGQSEYCPADVYKMDSITCGNGKMCLKEKCVPVSKVRKNIAAREPSDCPFNCSGRGVCNSEGHCHCEAGFAPPLCDEPGAGGSVDSGPATDLSVLRNITFSMYVIFLGIIPSIALLCLVFHHRQQILLWKSFLHYVACNTKNYFKNLRNKMAISFDNKVCTNEISSPDDTNFEPPLKRLNKDEIRLKPNVVLLKTVKPMLNVNKGDIEMAIDDIKVKPVTRISKIDENDTKAVNTDVKPKIENQILNINKNDIQTAINNVKLKPVKPMSSKNDNNIIGVNRVNPMLNSNKNYIETGLNNVTLKHIKSVPNTTQDDKEAINKGELKPLKSKIGKKYIQTLAVEPHQTLNIHKHDIEIEINNVKLKHVKSDANTNQGDTLAINNDKLKPLKLKKNIYKDDIEMGLSNVKLKHVKSDSKITQDVKVAINNVKLKPVKPISNIGKNYIQTGNNAAEISHAKPVLNITKNYIDIGINNIKLEATNKELNSKIYDIERNTNCVQLNLIKPIVTNKRKPSLKSKPEELKSKQSS